MRRIVFLVCPGFGPLDLTGPMSAFSVARSIYDAPYEVGIISAAGGMVTGNAGLMVATDTASEVVGHGDTVVAVGGPQAIVPDNHPETSATLQRLASSTRRIASVCTGAFYLAEAGILNGRRATTHWRYAPLLQSRFPSVSVEVDRIFVKDRSVWTSAGISAGIDLALAMIEADFGPELARSVARELVVYHRRPGGQSQFSALLELEPASGRVRDALAYARNHLNEALTVERLAEAAFVSSRQFARIFLKETGETPARAIERLRAEAARPRVEDGLEPIEFIARDVGFGDVERMRRTFVKLFGHSPQTVRRLARAHAEGLH
ncbi:GlxA family transcriptional regulator [Methylocapsa sp. S129]|uniref:GlxA family transcriptional regulator n=1 Tax=Methylocapsa sp. S129 TaxID=1641869 RepID=UPI00131D2AB8|nr:GlxA family transcriptional regulator [Methylocapsa sp. S129]